MKMKKIGSFMMAFALLLSLLPAAAIPVRAYDIIRISEDDFVITKNSSLSNHVFRISGSTTEHHICIETDEEITLILDNVSIDLSGKTGGSGFTSAHCPIDLSGAANCIIQLIGTSTLKAGTEAPGIHAPAGNNESSAPSLTIANYLEEEGRLTVTGGQNWCGIGIGKDMAVGINNRCDIQINGGSVTATGGAYGAGIGGGLDGYYTSYQGKVTINGGSVTATGGANGAGIGGGNGGHGGTVIINGGSVTANGGANGAGIGGGMDCGGGTVIISGGSVTANGGSDAMGIGRGRDGQSDGTLMIDENMWYKTSSTGSAWTLRETATFGIDNSTRERYMFVSPPIEISMVSGTLKRDGADWTLSGTEYEYDLPTGYYRLATDITANKKINVKTGETVVLDLNGHGIYSTDSFAVGIYANATLTLRDSNPTHSDTGAPRPAGVIGGYLHSSGNIGVHVGELTSTFNMEGGTITGCGWVGVYNDGMFRMSGGAITGNSGTADSFAGGVYNGEGTAISVSGKVTITGNTAGDTEKNVYLPDGQTITVGGALESGTRIGVTMGNDSVAFTSGYKTNNSAAPSTYFFSDSAGKCIVLDGNEAKFGSAHTFVTDAAVAATCTETGLTEGSHCSGCGEVRVAQEVVPATGHSWGDPTYSWTKEGGVWKCTATRTCTKDAGHKETETVTATGAVKTAATCEAAGTTTYTATFENSVFAKQTKDVADIAALDHDWDEAIYIWAEDYSNCLATRSCKRDESHVETETATATGEVKTAATCTTDGVRTYTATFTNPAFSIQSTTEMIPQTGHSWGTPTYNWKLEDGAWKCTATRVCEHDASHMEAETVTATGEVKTAATCEAAGTTTYTATFTNGAFDTQTKDVADIPSLGHSWGEPNYDWKLEDGVWKCTGTRACGNDANHVETETVTVGNFEVTAGGKIMGTATFENEAFAAQTQEAPEVTTAEALRTVLSGSGPAAVRLGADLIINSTLNVSGTKYLDLNGHGILFIGSAGNVIFVNDASTLNLSDSNPDAVHYVTLNEGGRGTAVSTSGEESKTCIKVAGGYLTGGYAPDNTSNSNERGGAIKIGTGGQSTTTVNMSGGTLVGNFAAWGGGVFLSGSDAKFTMSGTAAIRNNKAFHRSGYGHGDGVYLEKGAAFEMNGGTISSTEDQSGVWVAGATFTMTGGTVSGHDVGVHTEEHGGKNSVFQISGAPVFSGNAKDVELAGTQKITVVGAMSNTAPIRVNVENLGVFTDSANTAYNDAAKFRSEDADTYAVDKNGDGQLQLSLKPSLYNVTVSKPDHGTLTADKATAGENDTVTVTVTPDQYYALERIGARKTSLPVTLTALAGTGTGDEGYAKLVDGNTDTKWCVGANDPYLIVKADSPFALKRYILTTANDTQTYPGRNWENWTIYGANFDSDVSATVGAEGWTVVTSVRNDKKLEGVNFTSYTYDVKTTAPAYQYYKLVVESEGDTIQMSELQMFCVGVGEEITLTQDDTDPAKYTFAMPADDVTVSAVLLHVHAWGKPSYEWALEDGAWKCTATRVCEYDASHVETETVTATGALKTAATCETMGTTTYTATFTNDAFATQTKGVADIPSLGHTWGEPNYDWKLEDGAWKCTGTRTCTKDSSHVETETVTVDNFEVTAGGKIMGTATFENKAFAAQTQEAPEVTTAEALRTVLSGSGPAAVRLGADLATDSTLNVSGTKYLDLNGRGILFTGSVGNVILVTNGATLNLSDSNPTAVHYVTLNGDGRGIEVSPTGEESETCIKVAGGYLTGGYAPDNTSGSNERGGAIRIGENDYSTATVNMSGGTLVGNFAAWGGGVFLSGSGAKFTMSGTAAIRNNKAFHRGGYGHGDGVYLEKGAAFEMNGGTISNTEDQSGVWVSGATFTMTGGTVSGHDVGVHTEKHDGKNSVFQISGAPAFSDNAKDIELSADQKITVVGTLTNAAPIGLAVDAPGVFTDTADEDTAYNDAAKFRSEDTEAYTVDKNDGGQLQLIRLYAVTVIPSDDGTVTADKAKAGETDTVTVTVAPDQYYALERIGAHTTSVTLTALAGTGTGDEGYAKLVDGKTSTKWCVTGYSNYAYLIVKADSPFALKRYVLTTANDTAGSPGRNWKNWTIYGANFASGDSVTADSTEWTVVTSVSGDTKLEGKNFTSYTYELDSAGVEEYQYYKLVVEASKGANVIQMSELQMMSADGGDAITLTQDGTDPAKYSFAMPADDVTVRAAFIHTHTIVEHPAVAATATENGNSAYWSCSVCGKYFSDENGEHEIEENSWIIPASPYIPYLPAAADDAEALAAKQVTFNGIRWYVIADNAASAGTVTLLAAEPIGASRFNEQESDGNKYKDSVVQAYLDGLTSGEGAFVNVADAIRAVDLTDVGVTGAKLYLLSGDEASALPESVRFERTVDKNWWLRDPGYWSECAVSVGYLGYVDRNGIHVDRTESVRPALQLDLSKVVFSDGVFYTPVTAEWDGTTLRAHVAKGSGILFAAAYNSEGKQMRVWTQTVDALDAVQTFSTGLTKTGGYTYKLFLLDATTYVPSCRAWSETIQLA